MKPLNKIKLLFLMMCFFALSNSLFAQITLIPDASFEQALINLGIDSDGIINGQVLTSDVNIVIDLDLSSLGAGDLTGIEDFTALETLNVNDTGITSLDISNNIELKELIAVNNVGGGPNFTSLDFSNNINLEYVYSENIFGLVYLNLKNGNNSILDVVFNCKFEMDDCELILACVIVDDDIAATNNEPPYDSWFIDAEDFIYSEDCILKVTGQNEKLVSLYPNPTKDKLTLQTKNNNAAPLQMEIYSMQGKLLQTHNRLFEGNTSIDVSAYSNGVYFISVKNENGNFEMMRFIKESQD